MLKMMGWTEGTGLGTSGEGRVDPMFVHPCLQNIYCLTPLDRQTAIYAQGVGLGASKGRELGKYTEGYSGYVNMVQDAVSDVECGTRLCIRKY